MSILMFICLLVLSLLLFGHPGRSQSPLYTADNEVDIHLEGQHQTYFLGTHALKVRFDLVLQRFIFRLPLQRVNGWQNPAEQAAFTSIFGEQRPATLLPSDEVIFSVYLPETTPALETLRAPETVSAVGECTLNGQVCQAPARLKVCYSAPVLYYSLVMEVGYPKTAVSADAMAARAPKQVDFYIPFGKLALALND